MFGALDIGKLNDDLRHLAGEKNMELGRIEASLHQLWDKRNGGDIDSLNQSIRGLGQEIGIIAAAVKESEAHLCCAVDFSTREVFEHLGRYAAYLQAGIAEVRDYLADRLDDALPH